MSAGTCTATGPCGEMAQAISRHAVQLVDGRPTFSNGAKLWHCPFCAALLHGMATSQWPWMLLQMTRNPEPEVIL